MPLVKLVAAYVKLILGKKSKTAIYILKRPKKAQVNTKSNMKSLLEEKRSQAFVKAL